MRCRVWLVGYRIWPTALLSRWPSSLGGTLVLISVTIKRPRSSTSLVKRGKPDEGQPHRRVRLPLGTPIHFRAARIPVRSGLTDLTGWSHLTQAGPATGHVALGPSQPVANFPSEVPALNRRELGASPRRPTISEEERGLKNHMRGALGAARGAGCLCLPRSPLFISSDRSVVQHRCAIGYFSIAS